jgi:hypothetical protein
MYLIANFDSISTIEEYEKIYFPELKNKDIGILVLNAGGSSPATFSS